MRFNPFPTRVQLSEHRNPLLLCLASGLFGGLLFHQNALGLLGWLALIPYFLALPRLSGKMLAWGTMLFGCTWYYLGLFWLHTLIVFSWLVPLGVIVGVIYISLYFLLFAYPAAWCSRNLPPWLQPWAIAASWTAVEFLRNFTDMAFPWNLLGHSQVPFNYFHLPLVSISGISIISFSMALINSSIALFLRTRKPSIPIVAIILIFALPFAVSIIRFQSIDKTPPSTLPVSIIQPGFDQLQRWNAMMGTPGQSEQEWYAAYQATEGRMEETIGRLIRQAGTSHPDLIVLPESPFLIDRFPYQHGLQQGLWNLARETSATIFLGGDNLITRTDYSRLAARGQRFLSADESPTTAIIHQPETRINDQGTTEILPDREPLISLVSSWQITPENGVEPYVYSKMQLVPFGENIPFIGGIDWLVNALDASGIAGRFRPGLENTIFTVKGIRFGTVICFESTFPYLTRHLSRAGAQFFCVQTNDSWYDPNYAIQQGGFWGTLFRLPGIHQLAAAGPKQHFIHTRLRAIETNLPVLRSANTGISAVIDGGGRILESLPYATTEGIINAHLPLSKTTPTLFDRFGDWFSLVCAGIWLALCLLAISNRFR